LVNVVIFTISASVCEKAKVDNRRFNKQISSKEKRILIEQIFNKIIIDKKEISFEFAYQANSFKGTNFSQHNERGNETLKTKEIKENPPILNEPLMNEIEAAKFLGIFGMTLLRKRNAQEIGFYQVGHRVLYSKEKPLIPFWTSAKSRNH
jgi:hypothetical protein